MAKRRPPTPTPSPVPASQRQTSRRHLIRWNWSDPICRLWLSLAAMLVALCTSVAGYVWLCGWHWSDAVYMFLITVSTVGYGEIGPTNSPWHRWVNAYVIILGITCYAAAFSSFLQLLTQGELKRILKKETRRMKMENLTDHHIVCGFGRIGAMVCRDLQQRQVPVVIVESNSDRVVRAEEAGFLVVNGNATDEEVLKQAGVLRAKSLVCALPSDADNVFITLTGRGLNPKLFIIARAEQPSTEQKLRWAGADRIVAPALIGAQRIAGLILRPQSLEVLELVAGPNWVDLELGEVVLPSDTFLRGMHLRGVRQSLQGVLIVAVKRRQTGELLLVPEVEQTELHAGDSALVLGRRDAVERFRQFVQGHHQNTKIG